MWRLPHAASGLVLRHGFWAFDDQRLPMKGLSGAVKVYRVGIGMTVMGVAVAVLFIPVGVIAFLVTLVIGEWWMPLGSLVFVLGSGYIALTCCQSPRQIQQANDGSLVFVKMFGRDVVHIGDIQTIEASGYEDGVDGG